MKKFFLIFGISLAALLVVMGVLVGASLGPIVKFGMEQMGPKVTQVSIKVDEVNVSLLTGSATIKGLIAGNPDGYTSPQSFSVGTIAVKMDPMSVLSNKIVVHSVQVESPEITYEGGIGKNNLTKILDNVTAFSKNTTLVPANASSDTVVETSNKSTPKIEVDDFLITGAKVHVVLSGLVKKDLSLPDIHLTDLGKNDTGLTPSELTGAVLAALTKDILMTVTNSVTGLGQGVGNLGKSAVSTVGQSFSKITGSLGGLFGK